MHITFSKRAVKEFKKLEPQIKKRMDKAIQSKLLKDPENEIISLTGSLKKLYKFRVGNYRLVCQKEDNKLLILVVTIKHRKEVYDSL
jgi:mRNA interferase RelE/StbE